MAPPGASAASLPLRVLLVTTAVPPSLAMPAPPLVPVLPSMVLPVTIRRRPGGAGVPADAVAPWLAGPAQRGIRGHALRTGTAGRSAVAGWPFCPSRMPPPSPPAVFAATVLPMSATVPGRL